MCVTNSCQQASLKKDKRFYCNGYGRKYAMCYVYSIVVSVYAFYNLKKKVLRNYSVLMLCNNE